MFQEPEIIREADTGKGIVDDKAYELYLSFFLAVYILFNKNLVLQIFH